MIKINGTDIPTPSSYDCNIMDISDKDTKRNANGDIIIERIATKRKLELGYKYLNQADLSSLLQLVSSVFFTVEYPDAQEGAMKTGTFYVGDRNNPAFRYVGGSMSWQNIKFNLIER